MRRSRRVLCWINHATSVCDFSVKACYFRNFPAGNSEQIPERLHYMANPRNSNFRIVRIFKYSFRFLKNRNSVSLDGKKVNALSVTQVLLFIHRIHLGTITLVVFGYLDLAWSPFSWFPSLLECHYRPERTEHVRFGLCDVLDTKRLSVSCKLITVFFALVNFVVPANSNLKNK